MTEQQDGGGFDIVRLIINLAAIGLMLAIAALVIATIIHET